MPSTLVNSQLVCLPPVGLLNLAMLIGIFIYHYLFTIQWSRKAPMGSGPHIYIYTIGDCNYGKISYVPNICGLFVIEINRGVPLH